MITSVKKEWDIGRKPRGPAGGTTATSPAPARTPTATPAATNAALLRVSRHA